MAVIFNALLVSLLPSNLLTLCCCVGVFLTLSGKGRKTGSACLGIGAVGLALVFFLPIDAWLLRPLENDFSRYQAPSYVDGMIVLGGAISAPITADRGIPSLNRDADRLVAFAALAHRYPNAKLVFAGGPPAPSPATLTEAEASLTLLSQLGIAPERILVDDQSRNTWENAVNARALAHPHPNETWLLITSASHMPRAVGAFQGAGWPSILVPWPVAYRSTRHGWPRLLEPVGTKLAAIDLAVHEWFGLISYRLEGRTHQLFPSYRSLSLRAQP